VDEFSIVLSLIDGAVRRSVDRAAPEEKVGSGVYREAAAGKFGWEKRRKSRNTRSVGTDHQMGGGAAMGRNCAE